MNYLSFWLVLLVTSPLRLMPLSAIHCLGRALGTGLYYLVPKFRKRSLSNLSLATALNLSEKQIHEVAKASLQNLMITCLEYAKFASESDIHKIAICVNPQEAEELIKKGQSVIFFCGHQSNWEVLFLEGTTRMPGVAIGRPIKNAPLYAWVTKIRQKFGGQMIAPQNAIKEGLRGLKRGAFLGIVGDQGMPDSGYSSPFLGRTAWTSPIAALLSHRTGAPIIVATTKRVGGKYQIHYSAPIWPNKEASKDEEIDRLMKTSLKLLEDSIAENPGEWLWSHNRWKQQTPDKLKKRFRHESILILLPQEKEALSALLPHLSTFRTLYPLEFITIYAPKESLKEVQLEDAEILPYSSESDLLKNDYRFKLVFNFTSFTKIKPHFLGLSAFTVVSLQDLYACAKAAPSIPFPEVLTKAVCKEPNAS
jgi:Kdo2-lipid IVA lauroyltransferase/acyltransferase